MSAPATERPERAPAERRPIVLLVLGASVGLGAAAFGLLQTRSAGELPTGAVASVNGEPILAEEHERMVAALASDRRAPIDDEARRFVLERMIDEELLVQRGLELGMPRHDRRVRADLTSALIASVVGESENTEPNEGELESFYAENRDFFTRPGRLRVRQIFVRETPDAPARIGRAAERLRNGEAFETVRDELGDPEVAPLPDALLPPVKLREYLGPTALRTAMELEPGEASDPVRSGTGHHILELLEREPEKVAPLAEIEAQVRAEVRRRRGERALRTYLDELRQTGDVRIAPGLSP
jgi:parvulin-like peptidyl-prolyl isomerase